MDKKKGALNVGVSVTFKMILLIANILVRRFVIQYIGNEVNGLNSLYTSILGFLSVAELGVGSAITFCMYKPIVDGENDKVAALYHLFTKLYLIIGGIILAAGCAVMPFLKFLAKDYQTVNVNLYFAFGLMLVSVVLSYAFSSKTSLINAYKNNYITIAISSIGQIIQCGMQILVLFLTHSFVWYLICLIISVLLQWIVTEIIARVKYGEIIRNAAKVDSDTKKEVTKNVKAMFMHRIGGTLVNTADSIIISTFVGVMILGKYSNYTIVITAMISVLALCFSPLTSVIGHMCVEENGETVGKYYSFFHTFNFILGTVFFLGYYAVIDNLVDILFGANLEMARAVAFVITLNYFIQFMRQAANLFRDATGTFYYDRWKPIFEGISNIILSVLFVLVFPEEFKVVGVIVATIITNLFICHIVEPHVLYKYAFKMPAKGYYIRNYVYMAVFVATLCVLHFCMVDMGSQWISLIVNGCIAVALAIAPCAVVVLTNKDFRHYLKRFIQRIGHKQIEFDNATPPDSMIVEEVQNDSNIDTVRHNKN